MAGWIEPTTLGDLFARAGGRGDHEALVFPAERVTYAALAQRIDAAARSLAGLGIGHGDTVGVLLPQGVDSLALLFGATSIGAAGVPVNARFKAHELRHVITDSRMALLATCYGSTELADVQALLEEAVPGLADAGPGPLDLASAPSLRHVLQLGSGAAPTALLDRASFERAREDVGEEAMEAMRYRVAVRDPAVVMYTSGTTANPKGALLSHEALVRKGTTVGRTRFDLGPASRVWTPLPLYHIGGIAFAVTCAVAGSTYVHAGPFDADVAIRQLGAERCTHALPAFETIWLQVLDHPELPTTDLSVLGLVFNVGVPERLREMQDRLPGAVQVSGFGATESTSFVSIGQPWDEAATRASTCGVPLVDVDVRIVDPVTGAVVPAGVTGEIRYRGPCTFSGYLGDPAQTAAAFDEAGYFRSGDLGSLDEEGRLTFTSRIKDMLKVGGENVAAAEVEGFLLGHPAVALAQVVGAPDTRYGVVPAAFVQLKPGASIAPDELTTFCLGRIATFKVPRYVRVVTEWPMSGTKIKKVVLRDQIAAELAEAGIDCAPKLSTRTAAPDLAPSVRSGR